MKRFLLSLMAVVILSACTSNENTTEESRVVSEMHRGEVVYKQTCVGCHGVDLRGRGSSAKDLSNIGSEKSPEYIRSIIENGTRSMPSDLVTDEDDLNALVEWLMEQK
ncbi:hypothetical protein HMPREF2767_02605 [Nosocomiicoccus sp. HMSC067E10]|uniref:c-type cytochrome n=1 Tax=Nosocomiicoccus sp. HMSC067E10 TaxID=1739271 RepID=UPI0008A47A4B|nr:cytochrome c [Nosocomiicoccus sp. HMSC067E10]OFL47592.1 hypothetical protein HMPREF2767_02605 [Nosocomiicoccus sp. HMSC067E10]